jgi:hypothetical protein
MSFINQEAYMGAKLKNFEIPGASDTTIIAFLILITVFALFISYKIISHYIERRKLKWLFGVCKERKMTPKEVSYLERIVTKKNIKNSEELFNSVYSLNLPSPIKRKLMA